MTKKRRQNKVMARYHKIKRGNFEDLNLVPQVCSSCGLELTDSSLEIYLRPIDPFGASDCLHKPHILKLCGRCLEPDSDLNRLYEALRMAVIPELEQRAYQAFKQALYFMAPTITDLLEIERKHRGAATSVSQSPVAGKPEFGSEHDFSAPALPALSKPILK